MNKIKYTVQPKNPNAHILSVSISIKPNHSEPVRLTLPAWIPGSYMIRDFARNIISLKAFDQDLVLQCEKSDKQTWQIHHHNKAFTVSYDIYAWELSVRAAHLDQTHCFFNGTSAFLAVQGREHEPVEVMIKLPEGNEYANWKVATGLNRDLMTDVFSAGLYRADDYQQLIDCPVEMGHFDHYRFDSHDITHYLVFTGKHFGDMERIAVDVKKLCDHHLDMFEVKPDIEEYWFMTYITDDGYGGLEHPNSTALICSRFDLPNPNFPDKMSEGYKTFLGLCSHEYFHTWNVKRIKPAEFIPYALDQESYTRQLWAYEGFTSYYDDLSLARTGLVSMEDYLILLSKTFSRVYRGKGRHKQSVAESSFDAWTKFYKQDESAPNTIVSYYTKGAMIALCVDLMIRDETNNKRSLDDVMRLLWNNHGLTGIGTHERDFIAAVNTVCPGSVKDFLKEAIYSTDDLPLETLLARFGVEMTFRRPVNATDLSGVKENIEYAPSLGILSKGKSVGIQVTHVLEDSAAQIAGIAAKDHLLALDGVKVTASKLQTVLEHIPKGKTVTATLFREDNLMNLDVTLIEAEPFVAQLKLVDEDKAKSWLLPDA